MPIFVYNSLTRKKEEFIPLTANRVKMYTCGVTVYDKCHIGHARSLYVFDVIRRYLEYRNFDVEFVRNITDVDDKIINRSKELKIDWLELVNQYIADYYQDLAALGIKKADYEPRATENIPDMVTYITALIDKGYAYVTDTGVYFNVRKFTSYGRLSGQSIEQMQNGVRKEPDETKEDPLDFALWKKSKPQEPSWPSPWGEGRPGWHIECSVMSSKFLKTDTLDIHAGGRDLIFPHHENEIAQVEALTAKPFARYWLHHGLLTIDNQKMSKSLGNFVTIEGILQKYHPDILKVFYLQAHYSSPIDFSEKKMTEARQAYERISILKTKLEERCGTIDLSEAIKLAGGFIKKSKEQFTRFMDDDFNTPRGLSVLFDLVNSCNKILDDDKDAARIFKLRCALDALKEMTDIFGLSFLDNNLNQISELEVERLLLLRKEYKTEGNFAEADMIRKDLECKGIIVEDTKDGAVWRRRL